MMGRKTQIESAVNTYIGNYCYRKCFNHDNILMDCFKKFEQLKKTMSNVNISRTEFNAMMKSGEIKICKLPFEKRKQYVSWKYFEKLNKQNTDFWDK